MGNLKGKKYISQFPMMGTVISLTLFEQNIDAVHAVYDYLLESDAIFSANRDDSQLMQINKFAGIKPISVSSDCFALIKRAVAYSTQYKASFNVLMGPVVKLWKIGFGGYEVPDQGTIASKLALINPDDVVLNEQSQSVYLRQYGMELDLGAIAKGYFADKMVKILQSYGLKAGIVNLGGNVLTFGKNPLALDGQWHLGVQNPNEKRGQAICQVTTPMISAVTSGIKERFFEQENKIYHHILDPKTGSPLENDLLQVTILTQESLLGEVLSTVAFFKGRVAGVKFIESLENVEGIFITKTNEIYVTKGLTKKINFLNEE